MKNLCEGEKQFVFKTKRLIWFFFVKLSYTLSQFLLSWAELWKCTPTILMDNCHQAICLGLSILFLYATPHKVWLFEKFIFEQEAFWKNSKIYSILVRRLKSLKKMVVLSAKFIILISWSPICIDINENCNYFSLNNIVGGGGGGGFK